VLPFYCVSILIVIETSIPSIRCKLILCSPTVFKCSSILITPLSKSTLWFFFKASIISFSVIEP